MGVRLRRPIAVLLLAGLVSLIRSSTRAVRRPPVRRRNGLQADPGRRCHDGAGLRLPNRGLLPPLRLIEASDGNFDGTTAGGSPFGGGSVFKLIPGGVVTAVHVFDCSTEGCNPFAVLIQARDGNFYGITTGGGGASGGAGTVFIAERTRHYLLRSGFALSTTVGASKQSVDAAVGARCGSFVPFGTWRIVAP